MNANHELGVYVLTAMSGWATCPGYTLPTLGRKSRSSYRTSSDVAYRKRVAKRRKKKGYR